MKTMFYLIATWIGGAMMCFESALMFVTGAIIFGFFAYKFGNAIGINNE